MRILDRLSSVHDQVRGRAPSSPKVFIVGTGRSGTHWLARSLAAHPEVKATIERWPIFGWVRRMALDPGTRDRLLPRAILYYRLQHLLALPRIYLDKSHPALWIAEDLAGSFPEARFLVMARNPYATVASMLRHHGVLEWHRRWRRFPIPNAFLGIRVEDADRYADLPLATRCAMRWKAHWDEAVRLDAILGKRMRIVTYEGFMAEPAGTLHEITSFIGLRTPPSLPRLKRASLDRWREELSHGEIRQIRAVVGMDADDRRTEHGMRS